MIKESLEALAHGFKFLKLKVGLLTPNEDVRNVKAVREAVGKDVIIMIDANGAWDYDTALAMLKKLERYDISMAEQPVPYLDRNGLKVLRYKVGIPIMADESAFDAWDTFEVINSGAIDALLIKVVKAGGILKSQRWVSVAKAAGLQVYCGCMVGCGVEAAAQAHFLAAIEWMGKALGHENLGPYMFTAFGRAHVSRMI